MVRVGGETHAGEGSQQTLRQRELDKELGGATGQTGASRERNRGPRAAPGVERQPELFGVSELPGGPWLARPGPGAAVATRAHPPERGLCPPSEGFWLSLP